MSDSQVLMTPAEVAALFRVDPKTVTRWADAGKLTAVRTLGGHRRYRQDEVQNLLVASSISLPAASEGASVYIVIQTGLISIGPAKIALPDAVVFPYASISCYSQDEHLPPSSSGLGRCPFTAVTRVRIPLGVRKISRLDRLGIG